MPFMILNFKTLNSVQFGVLVCAGICAVISQFSLTEAYKYAPASQVAVYDYSSIIFSGIIGLIFWSEIPDVFSLVGYVLIVGMLIFIKSNIK